MRNENMYFCRIMIGIQQRGMWGGGFCNNVIKLFCNKKCLIIYEKTFAKFLKKKK